MHGGARCRWLIVLSIAVAALSRPGLAQQRPAFSVHGGAPAVSPDGSKIAFLADRDGATDVYVISDDGTGETRLTHTPEQESQPEWMAAGRSIWFTVFANDASRVFSIDPDGKNQKQIGSVPGRAMRPSPEGKRILYWTGGWTAQKMFVSDLDGGNVRQLTDGTGVVWGSRWSRDGKQIAFADKDTQGALHVYVMNADGSGRRQVSHFAASDGSAQMPSWSPDDRTLAVQAGAKDVFAHIWTLDLAAGAAKKLAAHDKPYQDEVPAWFPDGKRIAFQSDRTGRMEIWVMNADGSGERQVTR